jgi:putative DNA primase/helicase
MRAATARPVRYGDGEPAAQVSPEPEPQEEAEAGKAEPEPQEAPKDPPVGGNDQAGTDPGSSGDGGPDPAMQEQLRTLAATFDGCTPCGDGFVAPCPGCDGKSVVHLVVAEDGNIRIRCEGGCEAEWVLGRHSLGLDALKPGWKPAADAGAPGDPDGPDRPGDAGGPADPGAGGAGGGTGEVQPMEKDDDPHRLARVALAERWTHADGVTARFWRGEFHTWDGTCYHPLPAKERAAQLSAAVKREMDRLSLSGQTAPALKVSARLIGDVTQALTSYTVVPGTVEAPAWLGGAGPFPAAEVLACRNGLVHLPAFVAGQEYLRPPTPRLFSPTCLDIDFDPDAPPPQEWLKFLGDLWPKDRQTIETLQEWLGYCLLPDTSQQKILMLIGPRRGGKGTIARVLRGLVGEANVAGPTLASLGTNFGLWPLLTKTVAVISDARLSGRTDATVVTERLLSISGEDVQTADRKFLSPVTTKLLTRFLILTNELPKFDDASGALPGRVILLRLTQSWYGREDPGLTDKLLKELPGILVWAIEGWRRLRERGHFVQPDAGKQLLEELEALASPIKEFVAERCRLGVDYQTAFTDLFLAWSSWCADRGRQPGDDRIFGRDLLTAVPTIRRVRPRQGKRSAGRPTWGSA